MLKSKDALPSNYTPLFLVPSSLEEEVLKMCGLSSHIIGIGLLEAGLNTFELLLNNKEENSLVILVGIGGSYDKEEADIGEVAVATYEVWADFGRCYPTHYQLLPPKIAPLTKISFNSPLVDKCAELLNQAGFSVKLGGFATVSACSFNSQRALFIKRKYEVILENMEGFAVAYACLKLKVPFLEVRVVSNLLSEPEKPWSFEKALTVLKEVASCLKTL